MGKIFGNLFVQFREFYKGLTPIKKASVLGATIISIVTAVIISLMLTGATYQPLLKEVPPDQLSLVISKLEQNNIPFKMEAEGNTILVPDSLLHSSQMVLMAQLGPKNIGSTGLELFEKQDFGVSSYAQRVNYQRALQGELIRAINTLSAVKRSKVILALPPKKTFMEESGTPTASVVLELYPGKSMQSDQIKGITYLVSSSVQGLDPENVTVVDSRGKVLSRKMGGMASGSSEFFEIQNKIERDLESRVESILSKALGAGKVIAKVNVSLNTKNIATVEEKVDAEGTAVLSSVTETENLDGARQNPAGIPGARANLPGAQDQGQIGFKQNVNKELKTTNFSVPKTVKKINEIAGAIDRISVAVLVDGKITNEKGEDGELKEVYLDRTPEELQRFEEIVKNAVGFIPNRGDSIKIENMRFQKEDFTEAEKLLTTLNRKKFMESFFKWSLIGFSLTLFFFIVIRPFMRWITDSFQDTVEDMLPRTIEELEELQSVDNTLPGMSSALPMLEESLDPDKAESELLKERIINLMNKDIDKASGAFSLWLVREHQ